MKVYSKLSALIALSAFAALIGFREYSEACTATGGSGAHEEKGHEHGAATVAAHNDEGFGDKACEDGLLAAVRHQLGFGQSAAAVKTAKRDDHDARSGETAGHRHDDDAQQKVAKQEPEHKGNAHGDGGHDEGGEGHVKLTDEQIKAAGIETRAAAPGALSKEVTVPGRIVLNANAQAKVVPKLAGTVAKVQKQIGEGVTAGEVLATIESREMADAKGEYLAAVRNEELAKSVYDREERLWKQKVTAEQDYLNSKNAQQEAKIKVDLAHQKLHTIGLSEDEISTLPAASNEATTRFYELRSPIAGKVTARDLVMGQVVSTDKDVFTIADLATVWIELAVQPSDLAYVYEGQEVRVQSVTKTATAKVVVISPAIDVDSRAAKVIAELPNPGGEWRIGAYVNAQLLSGKQDVAVIVPRAALQTIKGTKVVFLSDDDGFRMKPVTIGREDSDNVEILSGLELGQNIATSNTFILKAELGKAEAEHEH